jgi:queuine tRNA-ribosyltransferase
MRSIEFHIDGEAGQARATTLTLARGTVKTPVYMPVGTQAAVRSVSPLHLAETGTQILLANTYHLSQRPGEALVERAGGLHKFMAVDLPMLTDSGGFQVFSLKPEISEDGVIFQYEVDIAMVFDECLPYGVTKEYATASVARTTRWEARCKAAHHDDNQSLFGIIQGGFWPDLRKRSAEDISELGFDGYAIGGLSVGEGHSIMCDVLEATTPHMPRNAPRYLMGVGRPVDLVEGVARGVDMFDCVIQTRHARSGVAYTSRGRIRLTDRRFRRDMFPIDASCPCYTCTHFSRAYIHHLLRVGEVLSATLVSVHNITWFHQFMGKMRSAILDGTFEQFRRGVHDVYPVEKKSGPSPSKRKSK